MSDLSDKLFVVAEVFGSSLLEQAARSLNKQAQKIADMAETIKILETYRPYWAKGFTDDGRAAQAYLNNVIDVRKALGVDNHTAVMEILSGDVDMALLGMKTDTELLYLKQMVEEILSARGV